MSRSLFKAPYEQKARTKVGSAERGEIARREMEICRHNIRAALIPRRRHGRAIVIHIHLFLQSGGVDPLLVREIMFEYELRKSWIPSLTLVICRTIRNVVN